VIKKKLRQMDLLKKEDFQRHGLLTEVCDQFDVFPEKRFRFLVEWDPTSLSHLDDYGRLPLHYAADIATIKGFRIVFYFCLCLFIFALYYVLIVVSLRTILPFKDSSWHLTLKLSRWIYGSLIYMYIYIYIYILRYCSSYQSSNHQTARTIVSVVKEEEIIKEEEIVITRRQGRL
jgi:hypothetical protein